MHAGQNRSECVFAEFQSPNRDQKRFHFMGWIVAEFQICDNKKPANLRWFFVVFFYPFIYRSGGECIYSRRLAQ